MQAGSPRLPSALALLLALLLPLALLATVQTLSQQHAEDPRLVRLNLARLLASDSDTPPPALAQAPLHNLPHAQLAAESGLLWFEVDLPALAQRADALWALALEFRPGLRVYLNGELLADADPDADLPAGRGRLLLGLRHLVVPLPPSALRGGQVLQLRLGAPRTHRASLSALWIGPRDAVLARDGTRQAWQALRQLTAWAGVLVALFLGLVARVRREEPIYALSAAHVALLALLLAPYVLAQQPLPSPWWRMLLDVADLAAKGLLVVIVARWAGLWTAAHGRLLLGFLALCALIDLSAAYHFLSWSDFGHPWPWWALGSRAALLGLALVMALRTLAQQGSAAAWGNALLVAFTSFSWAWISLASLALQVPVTDSNALAHAGWVLWVALLLQRHFIDGAQREGALRQRLAQELEMRTQALQQAFVAQRLAEREQAAAEQRRRLLQDLHDGLGTRLLTLRLQAAELPAADLAQALDACLLEMRLSVDTLSEDQGDLGVLLGSWRHRVEPMLRAAGLSLEWRVLEAPTLPCLRGSGALDLVRWLHEALANTVRHAAAQHVTLATQIEDGRLRLWWVDDGRGCDPQASSGMGRRSLAARAQRLGGELLWLSPPGPEAPGGSHQGTALRLTLPLD